MIFAEDCCTNTETRYQTLPDQGALGRQWKGCGPPCPHLYKLTMKELFSKLERNLIEKKENSDFLKKNIT